MKPLNLNAVTSYVAENIGGFHQNRLEKLQNLMLAKVLKRKNPYLFRAKNILTAESFVRTILDAYLSSQEETLFGDFLEGLAIFVCQQVHASAYKPAISELTGIDLVFQKSEYLYLVEIKSGPNWGNSSQVKRMVQNFIAAKEQLLTQYTNLEIVAVNGCVYGRENTAFKRNLYWKICGQDFWRFISENDELYIEIIEPLAYQAKQRNDEFEAEYAKIINRFTSQFFQEYCLSDGAIDWGKLVKLVSQREIPYPL